MAKCTTNNLVINISNRYRFVGRKQYGMALQIPYGAEVEALTFGPRRKVMVKYKGQTHITATYLLRKIKEE